MWPKSILGGLLTTAPSISHHLTFFGDIASYIQTWAERRPGICFFGLCGSIFGIVWTSVSETLVSETLADGPCECPLDLGWRVARAKVATET